MYGWATLWAVVCSLAWYSLLILLLSASAAIIYMFSFLPAGLVARMVARRNSVLDLMAVRHRWADGHPLASSVPPLALLYGLRTDAVYLPGALCLSSPPLLSRIGSVEGGAAAVVPLPL